jgi:hypothetical protein
VYRQAAEEAEGTIRRLLSESGGKARLINVERIVAITTDTSTPK